MDGRNSVINNRKGEKLKFKYKIPVMCDVLSNALIPD